MVGIGRPSLREAADRLPARATDRYIAGDPLAAFARVYLAELLASLGRLDEAGGSLDDAQRLEPDRSDWYANQRSYLAILRGTRMPRLPRRSACNRARSRNPRLRWRCRPAAIMRPPTRRCDA